MFKVLVCSDTYRTGYIKENSGTINEENQVRKVQTERVGVVNSAIHEQRQWVQNEGTDIVVLNRSQIF